MSARLRLRLGAQCTMAVLLETSKGDMVVDLFTDDCPLASRNFLKLCKCGYVLVCTPTDGAHAPYAMLHLRLLSPPHPTRCLPWAAG